MQSSQCQFFNPGNSHGLPYILLKHNEAYGYSGVVAFIAITMLYCIWHYPSKLYTLNQCWVDVGQCLVFTGMVCFDKDTSPCQQQQKLKSTRYEKCIALSINKKSDRGVFKMFAYRYLNWCINSIIRLKNVTNKRIKKTIDAPDNV